MSEQEKIAYPFFWNGRYGAAPTKETSRNVMSDTLDFIHQHESIKTLGHVQDAFCLGVEGDNAEKVYDIGTLPFYTSFESFYKKDIKYNQSKLTYLRDDKLYDVIHFASHYIGFNALDIFGETRIALTKTVLFGDRSFNNDITKPSKDKGESPMEVLNMERSIKEFENIYTKNEWKFSYSKIDYKINFHLNDNGLIDIKNSPEILHGIVEARYADEKIKRFTGKRIRNLSANEIVDLPVDILQNNNNEKHEIASLIEMGTHPDSRMKLESLSPVAKSVQSFLDSAYEAAINPRKSTSLSFFNIFR